MACSCLDVGICRNMRLPGSPYLCMSTARCAVLLSLFLAPVLAAAQASQADRSSNQPVEPFRIAGNVYYVGANEITSFLITTPAGHIVIDGGFVETAPQILANIRRLGFRPEDVKVLLNTQAHYDHAAGLAQLKQATGASFAVMAVDAPLLAAGGHGDFAWGDKFTFPPIQADRLLHDGDTVELGGVTLKAVLTPGHTKGCTTWTTTTTEHGRTYHVVFLCSTTVPGYRLVGNANYPDIVADYRESFRRLEGLPCDVFLASHGGFFHLTEKRQRLGKDASHNPFVDPLGYRDYLRRSRAEFEQELSSQQRGKGGP